MCIRDRSFTVPALSFTRTSSTMLFSSHTKNYIITVIYSTFTVKWLFNVCIPVSYTHLDVYKRQGYAKLLLSQLRLVTAVYTLSVNNNLSVEGSKKVFRQKDRSLKCSVKFI